MENNKLKIKEIIYGYDCNPVTEIESNKLDELISLIERDTAWGIVCAIRGIGTDKINIQEIADYCGCTRERIRQIAQKKERQIRHKWRIMNKK